MPKNPSILIVDDEPSLREILQDRFSIFGFDTFTSESGNKAWSFLEKTSVDIVLTDIRMPDGNGVELLKKIRAKNSHTPKVYAITGFSQDYEPRDLYHLGADGFVSKPFDAADIRNGLQKSLLPEDQRWGIEGRYQTDKNLLIVGDVHMGRGGFSCATKAPHAVNTLLNFDIAVNGQSFSGIGKVLWTFMSDKTTMGLEFVYLPSAQTKTWKSLTQNTVPYIPQI